MIPENIPFDNPVFIGVAALGVFGIITILILILLSGDEKKERKMEIIKGSSQGTKTTKEDFSSITPKSKENLTQKLKDKEKEGQTNAKDSYKILIQQAGLSISMTQFFIFSGLLGLMVGLTAYIFMEVSFLPLLAGIIAGLGVPRIILKIMAGMRQKKFLDDFADVLESMVRMLKAGMPVSESIAMVAREYKGPVAEEMSIIYDEQRVGTPLPEAITKSARRMPLTEMKMFATAITIQQQTGASLSEVLSNLAALLRARYQLKRKIVALSAEAKYTSVIIGSLPVFVSTALYFINPEYITLLFTDSFGRMLLSGAIIWMGIGIFIMRKMINFKV